MAVDQVSALSSSSALPEASSTQSASETAASSSKKIDPNAESQVLEAAVSSFIPSMMSNMMQLNNSVFNFAKEAIDEGNDN
ncbi:hypothetical protein ACQ3G6_09640 [Allorhizobium undicola]|uniref:hypothetical protein n=1 Tax=Allorhizobium undicola TaxID=78527 RepID=UPI0004854CE5|nr:hypothetical protein [Allorhizobium undicola]